MGTVKTFSLPISPLTQSPRKCWIYLPSGYETSKKTYPVLYMFDGHNLFFDETATYGKSWGMKTYLDRNKLDLIVVGQDCHHKGDHRLWEYDPYPAPKGSWIAPMKPQGKITAKWFVKSLIPYVNKHYRVSKKREHCGIAGSSMGGLMSMYCITAYNDIFSKAACLSSTMDIIVQPLCKEIDHTSMSSKTKIYMDFGSNELRSKTQFAKHVSYMLTINKAFQEKGCQTFPNIILRGEHSEASWEKVVPVFLKYLYPELFEKETQ